MIFKNRILAISYLILFIISIMFLTSSCVSTMAQEKKLTAFNELYCSSQYSEAAHVEIKNKGEKKTNESSLLPSLQAAVALRYAKQYEQSSKLLDECEDIIKIHNEQILAEGAVSNLGAVLINDSILNYRAREYDGVMLNTYKALNFWQEGRKDLARIEFNRALDRQRRAKERFASEIAKLKEELEKKQEEQNEKARTSKQNIPKIDINKAVNNPEIDDILKERYSNLYEFETYPDFINPFTTYVAGLFFLTEKDFSKATDLLKETYGMLGDNPVVASDFATLEGIAIGTDPTDMHTWIVFENGLGPEIEEFRIDLPILLFTNEVKYTGIALPKLKYRDLAYSHLTIYDIDEELGKTASLVSMDRVVQTEFKKRYPSVVTRAVTSTLIKTFGQYMAQKEFGQLGGFAAAIYQAATTGADIRIWTALPKEFQIAKIKTPDCGLITLQTPAGEKIDIPVSPKKNSLIYLKIPTSSAKAVYDVIEI